MVTEKNEELELYRKEAIKAATELAYSPSTILKIKQATTSSQITSIMIQARINMK